MSLKVLIIEDEYLGLERLERQLISLDKNISIVGKADSVKGSVEWLQKNEPPDLIMMDIDLGDGQSFEIFQQANISSHVIFTTSYDEHALHAFQENKIDHLLKPIRKGELLESINKYLNGNFHEQSASTIDALVGSLRRQLVLGFRQRFLAREGKRIQSIELDQVSYFFCDTQRSYLRTLDKKKLQIDHSIDEIELSLDPAAYFRVNESWIISTGAVVKINTVREGQLLLQLRPSTDKAVTVERERTTAFKTWFKK
jgi:two-component system response regulator LytT